MATGVYCRVLLGRMEKQSARGDVYARARRCCVNRNWHRALPRVGSSPIDRERLWSTKLGHSIEHVARKHRFDSLRCASPTSKSIAENRLVPEERVLDAGLSMIADLVLSKNEIVGLTAGHVSRG